MSFHVRRFDRSAPLYESEAGIQSGMAGRLLQLWRGSAPANILEFGCGTGILTRRLRERFPESALLATDGAPAMLAEAGQRCQDSPLLELVEQNAEGFESASATVLARAPVDLIASNALVQWFPDLERHFRFAAGVVRPGAIYLVSGFARSNFPELNALLAEPPFSYTRFPGHNAESLKTAAIGTGWKVVDLQQWEEAEIMPSARKVLRRIQTLGSARSPDQNGRMNRGNLEYLVAEYGRRFAENGGVRLTWKPYAALLQRL